MKHLIAAAIISAALPMQAAYHVTRHFPIGGDGRWDYLTVDMTLKRLFVSHGTEVDVVNLASGKQVGVIDNLDGVHGIALAQDLGRGYITSGRSGMLTVFELSTLKKIADWKATGENPDAVLYDRSSRRVFTFNGRGKNATVFDAMTGNVVATLDLGGKPEFAQARGDGTVFVNIEDTNEIAEIDAKNAKVVRKWSIAPCEAPTGLAFDVKHARLISVCENKLMVISDSAAGKVVTTAPIGEGSDGVAFDATKQLAFSSNGRDGTITVVHEVSPDKFEVVETVQTARGARTIAINDQSHFVYTPTAKVDENRKVQPGTFEVLEVVP